MPQRQDAAVTAVKNRIAKAKTRRTALDKYIEQNEAALQSLLAVESLTVRVVKPASSEGEAATTENA